MRGVSLTEIPRVWRSMLLYEGGKSDTLHEEEDTFLSASDTDGLDTSLLIHLDLQQKAQEREMSTRIVRRTPCTITSSQVLFICVPVVSFSSICSLCFSKTFHSKSRSIGLPCTACFQ